MRDRIGQRCPRFSAVGAPALQLPPQCNGSLQHFASLALGLQWPVDGLGLHHGFTPLSAKGPGCSGWLLAIARRGPYPAYVHFLLGNEALQRWPFVPDNRDASGFVRDPVEDMEGGPEDARPRFSEDYAARFRPRACPLCHAAELSTFHVICECTHAAIADVRQRTLPSAGRLHADIAEMCNGILESQGLFLEDMPDVLDGLSELPAALSTHPLTAEAQFLLYWTVAACPWPAEALPVDYATARGLGTMFDTVEVRHQLLRPLADCWLQWSESTIRDFATAWTTANALVPA